MSRKDVGGHVYQFRRDKGNNPLFLGGLLES
jgi:hypothetical protein